MKIRTLLLSVILMFAFSMPSFAAGENANIPDEVLQAASKGLEKYKPDIRANYKEFGFNDGNDSDLIQLGTGIKISYLNNLDANKSETLLDKVKESDDWEFTIDIQGQPVTLMIVALVDGKYEAVQFGGNAKNYKNIFKKFSQDSVEPKLLKVYNQSYFIGEVDKKEVVLKNNATSEKFIMSDEYQPASVIYDEFKSKENDTHLAKDKSRGAAVAGVDTFTDTPKSNIPIIAITVFIGLVLLGLLVRFKFKS